MAIPEGSDVLLAEAFRELAGDGATGIRWSAATESLNINLAVWNADHCVETHVNRAIDVVIVVLSGRGILTLDDRSIDLDVGSIATIPRGAARSITARTRLAYVTIHRRRSGLMPEPLAR